MYECDKCYKCNKQFSREIDLLRHKLRKTTCYKDLSCLRCGIIFTKIGDLKRHLNRKNPCEDKRLVLDLQIKLKELDIKLVKAQQPIINNNTINIDTVNIQNIKHYYQIRNRTTQEIENIPVPGDLIQTIYNLCKDQYTTDPINKCINVTNDKLCAFDGVKSLKYNDIKHQVQKHIADNCDDIIQSHEKLTDGEMIEYNIPQRDFISDDKISILKKVPPFVNKHRNNAVLKNQLKRAVV